MGGYIDDVLKAGTWVVEPRREPRVAGGANRVGLIGGRMAKYECGAARAGPW